MADTITTYIGNGTQTDFSIPFDYLKKSFVRVYVNNTLLTGGDYGDTTVDYYFLDKTTVRLKTPPAEDIEVTIRRYTSATERIVSFEDASILKATDLDTSQLQSFHIAEEARDVINDALIKDEEENWDAQGHRITNVGDPVDGKDAINLDWYNEDAGRVQANADLTEQWKDETKGYRNEAETFKDGAEESYNLAKDWAIKMDGKVVEDDAEVDYSAKYWATSIKEYGVASIVVADNIDDVKQVSTNIEDVKLVGGDLEGLFSPPDFTDMGRVGTGSTDKVEITGGNIKTVADNIEDVKNVGTLIESGQVQIVIDSVETTNQNVIKAQQAEDNAKVSEGLAKEWAIKTDGLVNNEDYSSKYYAQQAKESADSTASLATDIEETITQAKQDISTAVTQGVSQVSSTGSTAVSNINDAYDQATENLKTVTQAHLSEITTAGSTQVQAVNTAGTIQVGLVEDEGTDQKALVTAEGTAQVTRVEDAGDAQIEAVNGAGSAQVNLVEDEGAKQVAAVSLEGSNQTSAVNSAGQAQLVTINASVQKAKDWAEKTDGEIEAGAYSAKYWAKQAAAVGGQSDWNEADPNNLAYIKNKPDLTVYALKTDISTIYRYKGSVDTYSQLPVASQVVGDVYNIATDDSSHGIKAGDNVAWNGSYWDNLSGYVDLSPYLTIENAANIYLRKDTAGTTYATKSELSSYATKNELSSYATKQEVTTGLAGKSDTNHTHTASQVNDFTTQVQSLINSSRITDYGRVGS